MPSLRIPCSPLLFDSVAGPQGRDRALVRSIHRPRPQLVAKDRAPRQREIRSIPFLECIVCSCSLPEDPWSDGLLRCGRATGDRGFATLSGEGKAKWSALVASHQRIGTEIGEGMGERKETYVSFRG